MQQLLDYTEARSVFGGSQTDHARIAQKRQFGTLAPNAGRRRSLDCPDAPHNRLTLGKNKLRQLHGY